MSEIPAVDSVLPPAAETASTAEPNLAEPRDPKPATEEPVLEQPAPEQPAGEKTSASEKPQKDASTLAETPLSQLLAELPEIVKEASHNEMWGVELADSAHVPTTIVLEKFLRANSHDIAAAKAQLIQALSWRKKIDPRKLLLDVEFDSSKFGDLGFVTMYKSADGKGKEIVTWNIYGAVKDNKATFGDVEEFIKWRSALMELSVQQLNLPSATVPIPPNGPDPYQMVQVHDYLNVSFLRMDPAIRAASKETIQTFSMAYPELLREKFFVNVPIVMGWVFAAMKLFLSPATIRKFHPLSYGSSLAGELPGWGEQLPVAYGGKGEAVEKGLQVRYDGEIQTAVKQA